MAPQLKFGNGDVISCNTELINVIVIHAGTYSIMTKIKVDIFQSTFWVRNLNCFTFWFHTISQQFWSSGMGLLSNKANNCTMQGQNNWGN